MAIITSSPILKEPKGISNTEGRTLSYGDPFGIEIREIRSSEKDAGIIVSRYSSVLKSPNITDRLEIFGLDLTFYVSPKSKIWLEIFYDTNLEPVFGKINVDKKWTNKTVNPQKVSEQILVYPEELEFITKLDLTDRLQELQNYATNLTQISDMVKEYYENLFRLGYYTREQTDKLKSQTEIGYNEAKQKVTNYKNNLNDFFVGSTIYKKLFKTYTLIAYCTKDFNPSLKGNKVFIPNILSDPNQTTPQVQEDPSFKIVQSLNNNLLLVDICHENRFAAKIPIPYHGAVFTYFDRFGKLEETENTK